MFGFPVNLQDSSVQKITNDADNSFPKIQQREVFYSVKDGNWTDINIWQTASGRVGKFPSRFDDVYIKHNVTNDQGFDNTIEINNLFISGKLDYGTNGGLFYARRFYVYGNVNCTGILDLTNQRTGASEAYTFRVYGYNNRIDNFIPSNGNGHFEYYSTNYIPQPVLSLNYSNVSFNGPGVKYLTGNLTTTGDLLIKGFGSTDNYDNTLDLRVWNLNVGGNLGVGKIYWDLGYGNGTLIRTGGNGGNVTIGGLCSVNGYMNLSGCDIEFKNGLTYSSQNNLSNIVSSLTDTWRFTTTATQYMQVGNTLSGQMTINAQIIVGSGVTLNLTRGYAGPIWRFNNSINGIDGTSKLVNACEIHLQTQTAAENIMQTGIADFATFSNTAVFNGNYTATISNKISTFHNLVISGTGTKSLGVNTTLNGALNGYGGTFECSIYNLNVNGLTTFIGGILSKTGSGNMLFVDSLDVATGGGAGLNFSGNPNVEFRNGSNIGLYSLSVFNTGTGQWKYTTNNQFIRVSNGYYTYNCSFLISGAITATIIPVSGTESGINLTNTFDGDNALSKLVLGNASGTKVVLGLSSTTMPMSTFGSFDFTTNNNSVLQFMQTGSFTIPYSTFKGLYIKTTSVSTLTLSSNTLIDGNLRFYGGYLECSSYALTINGTTDAPSIVATGLKKNNSVGLLLFGGNVNMLEYGGFTFDLSIGNPNAEFRGGFGSAATANYPPNNIKSGTGTWTFSTNNQSLANGNNNTLTIDAPIVISGGITLTIAMGGAATNPLIFNGSFNGNNAASKLLVAANLITTYRSATQPMATGILDTFTNLNTWIYGNSNQDIKGGPTTGAKQVYRNLTLNGGGTKTLQGYVSVLNTYTLTSPATLANNGFTLTNP